MSTAVAAFRALDGAGLARVDMFLTPDNRIVVNEINTLQGSPHQHVSEALGSNRTPVCEPRGQVGELALERHAGKAGNQD